MGVNSIKKMTTIGELGEKLVLEWLKSLGWRLLYHRWRCRWGEIDLIIQSNSSETIAFVEVKTRSSYNWDADGMLAVNPKKQVKLIKSAALFLSEYPDLSDLICRFDVALVSYKKCKYSLNHQLNQQIILGQPIYWEEYQLTLNHYIESAFINEEYN